MSDDANPFGMPRMLHHKAYQDTAYVGRKPHLVAGEGNDPYGMPRPKSCDCKDGACNCG